jgi:DNA gyrase subunit B
MRPLIENGHVYMALPPLFAIKCGKDAKKYVGSQAELNQAIKKLRTKNYHVARFKGLGEMNPDELYGTTMNPEPRRLARVTMADAETAARIFSVLMSDRVEPRKQFIIQYAKEVGDVDWHC